MLVAIRALFLRELQTRFGQYRLGYLWIFIEPLFSIGIMFILFGAIMQRTMPNISFVVFLLNGMVPFFMFRSGINQALGAAQANRGLFSYRPVKPIDALIARNLLELFLGFSTYIFFSTVLLWFGYEISFDQIPTLLFYWLLLFIFMLSSSLIFMVLGDFSNELNKFVSVLFFILYFLSGVIYPLGIIPAQYREYLLYNPLIHIFEPMRHAVAPAYPLVDGISLNYVLTWIVMAMFIGLLLYKRFERRMIKSK
ncbi:ABC transporter permease [Acinetobacter rudis]|uniref:Transport permease protein n=1 Tax=Acinetobacter rudis TaxID=632955 RepID=A0AAW8JDI9_9GAMM|nr:ABC transporter permease [Acinetobacter rudis]MDQ8937007.1 ABC transporter permease [Acinetobacter rudis]MDQ9019212.1 ABC transporter permease [Acinetobacter rudis]